ncbi:MAG TPA: glycosyltransferase [Candidatus Eisenbacteria bacterium]|nr:glycosyltransferase [Candidatus Eisenbacteria bacterium]
MTSAGSRRVLIVSYQYPPEGGSSGVLRTLKFSRYLPRHGWTPHILTLRESFYPVRDESLRSQIPTEAVVHRSFGLDSARHLSIGGRYLAATTVPDRFVAWIPFAVTQGLSVVRRHGIDVLYSTSPPPSTHLIAATLHRLTGLPWIADFRDPWIEEGQHPRPGTLRCRVEKSMERWVLGSATRVLATTPRLRDELVGRHPSLDPSKFRVVFNGYDESDFAALPPAGPAERFELIHAGLVTPEFRDPAPLLRAVADLLTGTDVRRETVRVTFLGGGPYVESEAFRESIRASRLEDVVEVAGRVTHGESLARQLRAAVLVVLQSSEDTKTLVPAKAFEYIRLGRPILSLTPPGATTEVLEGLPHCAVVDPAREDLLRDAVKRLYRDWSAAAGTLRPPDVAKRFERSELTRQLAALLDEVAPAEAGGGTVRKGRQDAP